MDLLLLLILCGLAVTCWLLFVNRKELLNVISEKDNTIDANTRSIVRLQEETSHIHQILEELSALKEQLEKELKIEKERNQTVISQKKSSETKLGQTAEHLVPFLSQFTHDPKNTRFLGSPIDLIAFDFDKPAIYFIEVKTGNSKESHRQKLLKQAIKTGKVYYEKLTVDPKGIKIKTAENDHD